MRLQRRGKKNYATYRVVVADRGAPVKGRFVADLGGYNPHTDALVVNQEDVSLWLGKGAQPSATVHNLLVTHNLLKADKVTSWRPKRKEGAGTEATPEKSETPAETKAKDTPQE